MFQITKSARMSFADKVSWVGGMLGLFTGFSLISGFEILYWLWFKVIFHKDNAVEEDNTVKVLEAGDDIQRKVKELTHEIEDIKRQLAESHHHKKHHHHSKE